MESLKNYQTQPGCKQRYILISVVTILICLSIQPLRSQGPLKLRSTLSTGGSGEKISSAVKKSYSIQQSVGQSGVIGTYEARGYILRQGFIQPVYKKGMADIQTLDVKVAPNPFSEAVSIRANTPLTGKINITIYDLPGKPVYIKPHYDLQELNIDLSSLPSGLYFLKMTSANKTFTTKLIKK